MKKINKNLILFDSFKIRCHPRSLNLTGLFFLPRKSPGKRVPPEYGPLLKMYFLYIVPL